MQTVETFVNVEVHSGIKYQRDLANSNVPGCQDDGCNNGIVHVPWRLGSERHLGILRRPESGIDDMPPPPY